MAWRNFDEDQTALQSAHQRLIGARSDAERAELGRLLDEAYAVLRSSDFRQALEATAGDYPTVYARGSDQNATPAEIAAIVALERPGARFTPAQVEVTDDLTGALGAAGEGVGSGRYADIVIGRDVLARFASPDVVERSCAINVAAHEYSHTISLLPVAFSVAFTDTSGGQEQIRDRRDPLTPVASYLIGAVAQCAWLEQQGRIDRADIRACIATFGVQAFNWSRCGQFAGGQPVAPREDLARPAPPL
ncbi:MAG: hypothetical protein DI570_08230 [Phenylobacterium zucineum]|nr:MAG: hypothetical protein DI570_08230 [Phenylobacterium zucineum]